MPNSKRPIEVSDPPVRSSFAFDSMEDALSAFARGEFLVVMDDENRENEGDLIIAANLCSTEKNGLDDQAYEWIHLCLPSR